MSARLFLTVFGYPGPAYMRYLMVRNWQYIEECWVIGELETCLFCRIELILKSIFKGVMMKIVLDLICVKSCTKLLDSWFNKKDYPTKLNIQI